MVGQKHISMCRVLELKNVLNGHTGNDYRVATLNELYLLNRNNHAKFEIDTKILTLIMTKFNRGCYY